MIKEFKMPNSRRDLRQIMQRAHGAKQRYFEIPKLEQGDFDPLLLRGELYGRRDLMERTALSFSKLSSYFREKVRGFYEDFMRFNYKIISALEQAVGLGE